MPRPGLVQQLKVLAHFSGGETRDVTDRAIYELTSAEVAEVGAQGLVTTRETGEADQTRALAYLREADSRAQGAEDLFWVLLNSRQFLFNH